MEGERRRRRRQTTYKQRCRSYRRRKRRREGHYEGRETPKGLNEGLALPRLALSCLVLTQETNPLTSRKPPRFSANRPRPQSPLDNIKFICKDLWPLLFRKQIDNLKTNHRGVFVLTDQRFQPISRVSVDRKAGVKASEETLNRAQAVSSQSCPILSISHSPLLSPSFNLTKNAVLFLLTCARFQYLYFPCGIIRGALAGLGMDVTVHADSSEIPAATFQIKTRGAKA